MPTGETRATSARPGETFGGDYTPSKRQTPTAESIHKRTCHKAVYERILLSTIRESRSIVSWRLVTGVDPQPPLGKDLWFLLIAC